MQNTDYLELIKETAEMMIKDHRPYRGSLRRQFILLLRRELINLVPKNFEKHGLNPIESIFVSVVILESDICIDLIHHIARFFSDSYSDSIKLQMQLQKSFASGSLSQLVEKDSRERLKIKSEYLSRLFEILIPSYEA